MHVDKHTNCAMINKRRQVMMLIRGDDTVTKMNKNEKEKRKKKLSRVCDALSIILPEKTSRLCLNTGTQIESVGASKLTRPYSLNTH